MQTKSIKTLSLLAGIAVVLTLGPFQPAAARASTAPILNMNLGVSDSFTLDPAMAADDPSLTVIEQLFLGLVDLDDETAEVHPELASSWTVSPDGTVYTFTLRNDVFWTDGSPVTAGDVRYSILRILDPALQSGSAYILYLINNAQAYYQGTITDPTQVGVSVLDATHLQITLEQPGAQILSILSHWIARPLPQSVIEAHPTDWTLPANIVTNGPYRLTEWVANDHILLDKNPTYYDAANVQIGKVKMWMVDDVTAWTMYLNGSLDTAALPSYASAADVLPQELHVQPSACTYYYGFSTTLPPFDNPLVRKAFFAATKREGVIHTVLGGPQRPALTFTAPGVFGYVDGYAEGVGIPYNPIQARQWLAQAGYPEGQGLPPITLTYNTSPGHQAIAEYIQDSWYDVLGVSVNLQTLVWSDYTSQLPNGQFQVWRMGWCSDYQDAYNFLHDEIELHRSAYGGWYNAAYAGYLNQAALSQNAGTRKALFKQAEEILVETDAVLLPIYHFAAKVATRPSLERTYSQFMFGNGFDISTWHFTQVSAEINTGGGSLDSYSGDTTIQVPAGGFTEPVTLTYSPAYGNPPGGNLIGIHHLFSATAVYSSSGLPASLSPGQAYTITVQYTDAEAGSAIEDTLALYYWDGTQLVKEPSSTVDTAANLVTATPDHLSRWVVLGETHLLYLPLVVRGY
jgi:oligopeptide transport system substrate-binding protein